MKEEPETLSKAFCKKQDLIHESHLIFSSNFRPLHDIPRNLFDTFSFLAKNSFVIAYTFVCPTFSDTTDEIVFHSFVYFLFPGSKSNLINQKVRKNISEAVSIFLPLILRSLSFLILAVSLSNFRLESILSCLLR